MENFAKKCSSVRLSTLTFAHDFSIEYRRVRRFQKNDDKKDNYDKR